MLNIYPVAVLLTAVALLAPLLGFLQWRFRRSPEAKHALNASLWFLFVVGVFPSLWIAVTQSDEVVQMILFTLLSCVWALGAWIAGGWAYWSESRRRKGAKP